MPKHELTTEERRKGAEKAAEAKREKRRNARRLAAERYADMTSKALDKLEELLNDPSAAVSLRATREVLERVLGRASSPLELPPEDGEQLHGWHGGEWHGHGVEAGQAGYQHKQRLTLGDLVKFSLSIGIDPMTGQQDIRRAEELLRRWEVPADDEAWTRLADFKAQRGS